MLRHALPARSSESWWHVCDRKEPRLFPEYLRPGLFPDRRNRLLKPVFPYELSSGSPYFLIIGMHAPLRHLVAVGLLIVIHECRPFYIDKLAHNYFLINIHGAVSYTHLKLPTKRQ